MLDAKTKERLAKILGMMGSDHVGERAAAALGADKLRREHNVSWQQLLGIDSADRHPIGSSRHIRSTGACYFIGASHRWDRPPGDRDRTIDLVKDFIRIRGWKENLDYMLLMPAKEVAHIGGSYVKKRFGATLIADYGKFLIIFDPRHAALFATTFVGISQISPEEIQKVAKGNQLSSLFHNFF